MAETQMTLALCDYDQPISTIDPNVESEDVQRLCGQNKTIFELLKNGPATNEIFVKRFGIFKYTSRISDIRKWLCSRNMNEPKYRGADIKCTRLGGGLSEYRLVTSE